MNAAVLQSWAAWSPGRGDTQAWRAWAEKAAPLVCQFGADLERLRFTEGT